MKDQGNTYERKDQAGDDQSHHGAFCLFGFMHSSFRMVSQFSAERLRPSGGAQEARIQQGGLSPSDAPACSL